MFSGITIDENISDQFNGTILDGEYVYVPRDNKHLFMVFDCLRCGTKDIRKEPKLMERLRVADNVTYVCFTTKDHIGYTHKEYAGKFNTNEIIEFHRKQIVLFLKSVTKDMKKSEILPLIRRKYFIPVMGGCENEIFVYSKFLWNEYVFSKTCKCPYTLDGLIFSPLEQRYTTKIVGSKNIDYKWKPPDKNSVDLYVKFVRNKETGKILTVYDETHGESAQRKPYKICNLYVGKRVGAYEKPVLFLDSEGKSEAFLFLENGSVRDKYGDIICDETVVEFCYDKDSPLPDPHKWIPLRIRYDKTESVRRFGKRYGNYETVAYRVWRSMSNPISYRDISALASSTQYEKQNISLRAKVKAMAIERGKKSTHFQQKLGLAKSMRQFHNFMKSILLYTICVDIQNFEKLKILDVGCGNGDDIMRFYHVTADYVGIDVNEESIFSSIDGASSKYAQHKLNYPNFPRMFFVHADMSATLTVESQLRALGKLSKNNEKHIRQFFEDSDREKFDRISCQFSVGYFLQSTVSWENFCENINNSLKPGGYVILTHLDASKVIKIIGDKESITVSYTNERGEKLTLLCIEKKYDSDSVKETVGVGNAINVYSAIEAQERVYKTEYLTDVNFLIVEFGKRCGLRLIDTDTFENQYYILYDYFKKVTSYEENQKTKQFLEKTADFYDQNDSVNRAGFTVSGLYRFCIFKKDT